MNKRQKKKLKKRHTPNIITEFRDITRIEGALPDEISDSIKKITSTFKPSIVPVDKIEVFDIIFQEDNKNDKKSNT